MSPDEPESDAEPVSTEVEPRVSETDERLSLTRLPAPDPNARNAPLSVAALAMLHADAATGVRMLVALGIKYPKAMQPRQYTAGLVSWTGRFVYPTQPDFRRDQTQRRANPSIQQRRLRSVWRLHARPKQSLSSRLSTSSKSV